VISQNTAKRNKPSSSFEDEDWTGLDHHTIKSRILSEFKEGMEIESAKQAHEQQVNCNNGKHVWMYSVFCDRCGGDFERWQKQIPKKVAYDILAMLQSVINEQVNSKRLDKSVGSYIYEAVKHEASYKGWMG
jgi:hypothetical protein